MLTDVDVSGGKRGTGDHGIDILKKSPLHGRPGADGFTRFVVLDGDVRASLLFGLSYMYSL
jgi:hypothetical protein